uniref:tetratricopeptide repeat protein n=1 Tax=Flavobacterium sp. TaxID=239 RepID=UPI004047B33C
MKFLKHFTFLFIFILGIQPIYSQNNSNEIKKAKELLKNAVKSFLNLETKKSLDFAQKALVIATKNEDDLMAAKAYNIIGLNFEEFTDYKKAIEYYKKGLDLAIKVNNDTVKG